MKTNVPLNWSLSFTLTACLFGFVTGLAGPRIITWGNRISMELFYPSASPVFRGEMRDANDIETMIPSVAPRDAQQINGVLYRMPYSADGAYENYKHPARAFREFVKIIGSYGVPRLVLEYPNNSVLRGIQQVNSTADALNFLNALVRSYWLYASTGGVDVGVYQNDFIIHYGVDLRDAPWKQDSALSWEWKADYYESVLNVEDVAPLDRLAMNSNTGEAWVFRYDTRRTK